MPGMSPHVTLNEHRVRREAADVRWAAAMGGRGAALSLVRAAAPVLVAGALLVPAGQAWSAASPRPAPGATQPPRTQGPATGPAPGAPGASAEAVAPGPATAPPAPAGPGGAAPSPTAGSAAPPGTRPSAPAVHGHSTAPSRPAGPPAAHPHDHDHDHEPGLGRPPGDSGGPLRPAQPPRPYVPKPVGRLPLLGGRAQRTGSPRQPYGAGPAAGSGAARLPALLPADHGASSGPTPSHAAHARSDEGEQAASPFDPDGPVMRVVPLGAGLMLVGLGLGFLGLRLRRR